MFTLQLNIKPWFLCFYCCLVSLLGCDNDYLIEKNSFTLTEDKFYQKVGFKLDYDLYLPNSYTGWDPSIDNKFIYDAQSQLYTLNNINISKAPIDNYGDRFKITSFDWQHEFGFTNSNAYIEESKFGLVKEAPSLFKIKHYSILVDSKDLFFELPSDANPVALTIKIKIISEDAPHQAWLMVSFVEK